jgi:hypothetical protein
MVQWAPMGVAPDSMAIGRGRVGRAGTVRGRGRSASGGSSLDGVSGSPRKFQIKKRFVEPISRSKAQAAPTRIQPGSGCMLGYST